MIIQIEIPKDYQAEPSGDGKSPLFAPPGTPEAEAFMSPKVDLLWKETFTRALIARMNRSLSGTDEADLTFETEPSDAGTVSDFVDQKSLVDGASVEQSCKDTLSVEKSMNDGLMEGSKGDGTQSESTTVATQADNEKL